MEIIVIEKFIETGGSEKGRDVYRSHLLTDDSNIGWIDIEHSKCFLCEEEAKTFKKNIQSITIDWDEYKREVIKRWSKYLYKTSHNKLDDSFELLCQFGCIGEAIKEGVLLGILPPKLI